MTPEKGSHGTLQHTLHLRYCFSIGIAARQHRQDNTMSITGTITSIKRTTSSVNGNPAYFVTIKISEGHEARYRTQTDTGWAYAVSDSMIGKRFTFELTATGRIRYAR